ncbi:uncharacterized protein LOC118477258 [Aplysia californica]|uniref:Uncharacterized protein LOC118477258 n=1 Tax=Aplysia californica TaxID=6500 RepID=A0ABM1VP86_APLCA|nr:uncharacterized protein LOC118477258 [Aplysia californica]
MRILRTGLTISLNSLSEEDHGYYVCEITYYHGTANSYENSTRRMSVPYILPLRQPLMPWLTFSPDKDPFSNIEVINQMFTEDQDIHVICRGSFVVGIDSWMRSYIKDLPIPGRTFSFFLNGKLVASGDKDGQRHFGTLAKGAYNYTCVVNDRVGNSSMSWPLLVDIRDAPVIKTDPETIPLNITGLNITLTCQGTENSTGYDIRWRKNKKPIAETRTNLELNLVSKYDEGFYTCEQQMEDWTLPRSASFPLRPSGRPPMPFIFTTWSQTVEVDHTLILHCQGVGATSTQATLLRWDNATNGYSPVAQSTKPELDDVGQILFNFEVKYVSMNHSGDYVCTMQSGGGESEPSDPIAITVVDLIGCAPGTYETEVGIGCRSCPVGTYQSIYGQTDCEPCPGDLFTLGPRATDMTQCIEIPPEKRIYFRLTVEMEYNEMLEDEVTEASYNIIRMSLPRVWRFLGFQSHSYHDDGGVSER